MKMFRNILVVTTITMSAFSFADPYSTEPDGDALINPGNLYCYNGAQLTVEKARSNESADITLKAGSSCSAHLSGKINLNGNVAASQNMYIGQNAFVKYKLVAKEVQITTNVPTADYVFEDDYELKPIDELEAFLKKNKHLPNIPSAAEFSEKGYKVGDMDNMLLEKVEELTLYIIGQDKRIKELESALNEQ